MTRLSAILAAARRGVVGLAAGGWFALRRAGADPFADCRTAQWPAARRRSAGRSRSPTATGRRVTDAEVITGPTLVYFGYSFCPDVCPMDLSRNALAAEELAERGVEVGQVFISIDPERDTPEVIRDFAAAIDPGLVGLTGTPEEIAAAAKAYKVYYRRNGDDPEYYLMDHSTFTYLMAPGTGFLEFYRSEATPEAGGRIGGLLCRRSGCMTRGGAAAAGSAMPVSPEDASARTARS